LSTEAPKTQPRSIYRRHRPRTFADVVGQEQVVRTLSNAITRDRVHHAYLFVGSRGTGKTSMAKILAASLNCEQGPTLEPCGVCESCVSIANATSIDVVEMDAASNNSVDDIRELRESVSFAPLTGRRKLYILDEAHMLSTAAWNAFLKTLEEPPPMTVFVLATTEADKVPATVVDRCHRFDFHRPTVEQISSVVSRVANAEQIEIPPEAIAVLSRQAAGSFRDALGLLEQIVTYSGSPIALEDVLAVIGAADLTLLAGLVDAAAGADAAGVLRLIEESCGQGRDATLLMRELEARARDLMIVQTLGAVPAELRMTPEADAALAEQAARLAPEAVVRLLELLGEALEATRAGGDGRTRLELALVKAARPQVDPSLRALLARLERLEGAGGAAALPVAGTVSASAAPVAPPVAPAPEDQAPADRGDDPPVAEVPAQEPPSPAPAAVAAGPAAEYWPAVVELVRDENKMLGALIAEAVPAQTGEATLLLTFAPTAAFKRKKAEENSSRKKIGEALHSVTGRRMMLEFALGDAALPDETDEQEMLERFVREFEAEEITGDFDDEPAATAEKGS